MPPRRDLNLQVRVLTDDREVDALMAHLSRVLDPGGIAVWLKTVMGPWIRKRASDRFRGEGDDVVGKWLPLQDSTKLIRTQMGYGEGPINVRTGELHDYITKSMDDIQISPLGATMTYPGTLPSGELQMKVITAQAGKPHPPTFKRPVLGMNERDLIFAVSGLLAYIQTGRMVTR